MTKDPGNQWCEEKSLSVRLRQIKNQWINLGERQQIMLNNLILSAEHLEEQLAGQRSEIAASKGDVQQCIEFWTTYSRMNEPGQDDIADQKDAMLEKMKGWLK